MFEGTHFLTAYLLARLLLRNQKGATDPRPQSALFLLCGAVMGLIPDTMEPFFGWSHATWSHTIVGVSGLAVLFALIFWVLIGPVLSAENIPFRRFLLMMWVATMSHLELDIVTHTGFTCDQAVADFKHIYFWPLWDQSFHLDCLFGWSYAVRTVLEWMVYLPVLLAILGYRWKKYGENPFAMLSPKNWVAKSLDQTRSKTEIIFRIGVMGGFVYWNIALVIWSYLA